MEDIRNQPELLRNIPLFLSLSDDEVLQILRNPENEIAIYGPREIICEQGDIGVCMYIILEGNIEIIVRGIEGRDVTVATLKQGDYFGEQALLPGNSTTRNATAQALHGATVLQIRKDDILFALSRDPEFAAKVSSGGVDQQVENTLKGLRLFQCLEQHDYDHMHEWAESIDYEPGEIIIRENEPGDYLYVILEGKVEVFIVDDDGRVIVLHQLERGNYFGEQALLADGTGRRNANVRSDGNSSLIKIPKALFRKIMERDTKLASALRIVGKAQREQIEQYLMS